MSTGWQSTVGCAAGAIASAEDYKPMVLIEDPTHGALAERPHDQTSPVESGRCLLTEEADRR
jgi:hypothetical protein